MIEGTPRHMGRMGTVLAIGLDNRALIRRVERHRTQDWSAYRTVLGCGPTLVREGNVDVRAAEESFGDPHVLGESNRSAGGLTAAGKLLLVSVPRPVSLERLARLMLELGCTDAMNLDGGASMAMYYRGRTVLPAGRRLTNILTVYEEMPAAGRG